MTVNDKDLTIAEAELVEEHQKAEKVINEEFKIWKKTVPLLYETIHSHALDFPSLSLQWLPDYTFSEDRNWIHVRFMFGTNSSQHSQDYLKLGSLRLPSTLEPNFNSLLNKRSIPIPSGDSEFSDNFRVLSSWQHPGEVNKLRVSPSGEEVLTFDKEGTIHLYQLKGTNEAEDFKYHKQEGFSLEWVDKTSFLSGANDSQIAFWNRLKPSIPIQSFKSHNAVINDLSTNKKQPSIFGSVADDFSIQVHDLRASINDNPIIKVETRHIQNAIAFNPEVSNLFAAGGKDNIVALYDLRSPDEPFRELFGHNDSVIGLDWNPLDPMNLYSWALDRRCYFWNLSKLPEDYSYPNNALNESSKKKNVNNIDPCLSFIHGGHTNRINSVDMHPTINGLTLSCGDDNLIEIWKQKTIFEENEDDDDNVSENSKKDQENND